MELRELRCFLEVAEQRHFTRAAERLHLSQPAVSRRIRKLERELRVALFDRTGRRAALTPAGRALLGPAREIVGAAAAVRSAFRGRGGLECGRVDVAAAGGLCEVVVEAAARVAQRHAGVAVRVSEGDPDDVARAVLGGAADLGVVYLPAPAGVLAEELYAEVLVAVRAPSGAPPGAAPGRPALPAPGGSARVPPALRSPLVLPLPGTSLRRAADAALAAARIDPVVAAELPSPHAILAAVRAGLGAALLPARLAGRAGACGLELEAVAGAPPLRVAWIRRQDRALTPAAGRFAEALRDAAAPASGEAARPVPVRPARR